MCKDEMVKDYSKTWFLNFLGERKEKEWVFFIGLE